jgi:hypothetical protein
MKVYRTTEAYYLIEEIEAEKVTVNSVWAYGCRRGRVSVQEQYHNTRKCAVDYLVSKLDKGMARMRDNIEIMADVRSRLLIDD